MPMRIRLSRAAGWRMPPNTVKVDRSTRWGNPFVPGKRAPHGLAEGEVVRDSVHAYELYRAFADARPDLRQEARRLLRGKNLACWCKHEDAGCDHCHASLLLEYANAPIGEA